MKKSTLSIAFCFSNTWLQSQIFYLSKSSGISFFSEALLENIKATSETSRSIINIESNEIAVVVYIRSFEFEKELVEEHFNGNYMESRKYKTAIFKGKINQKIDFYKNGSYNVSATGNLIIHGVEIQRTLNGTIKVRGNTITLNSNFKVLLEDHNIKIPKVVIANIAEEADVKAVIIYEPK